MYFHADKMLVLLMMFLDAKSFSSCNSEQTKEQRLFQKCCQNCPNCSVTVFRFSDKTQETQLVSPKTKESHYFFPCYALTFRNTSNFSKLSPLNFLLVLTMDKVHHIKVKMCPKRVLQQRIPPPHTHKKIISRCFPPFFSCSFPSLFFPFF